ncbi:hypothetical protein STM14_4296 [Salmonella enterica subsp. enterica serovar Typhimurium str. 14028S]|uniref:Uncharacterized protein n=2 Tax=Salmonella enterica I TaxID=59201 RepID=A0A0F6B836_SALT1|nr:hypothetical protein SPAB_04432 [Salmonella enterica subsp. enterica serovar Paratyphi B str. SPB7]ACY90684.1 hypothetical protein STM14_4296 [Salmonella enterica subsp. enterica serovar Typhimurium str. 14028S]EPI98907.1 hypothetical protein A677_02500 [Salmonella enterica subsp. enterica serovar Enteritidis str. 2010K-0267]
MHFFGHSNPLNQYCLAPSASNNRAKADEQREYHPLFYQTVILSTSSM